ncbi:uncharacterized protein LOC112343230 [Selaginella moellendorffii]|uniref:uncharacterized protein LOC112343230 n=1 Tax=Selaginella moellendorffii TaxID=88036 RepID=UPI000D1D08EB|nr:uncharacterized protein LOC112343230 [Selaginella moellendorffii]|eukprot:XP_024522129.1 uncharacterized protein LOC112343230 [Selaginella moellendorffii]
MQAMRMLTWCCATHLTSSRKTLTDSKLLAWLLAQTLHLLLIRSGDSNQAWLGFETELKEAIADLDENPEIVVGDEGIVQIACHPEAVEVVAYWRRQPRAYRTTKIG